MTEIPEPSEALSKIAQEFCAEFPGVFSAQTVERFVFQSFRDLASTSTIHTYLNVITQKFARERLKALGQMEGSVMKDVPEVLFVCVHNAGRSQAAMALLHHHGQGRVHVRSAGSAPGETEPWRTNSTNSSAPMVMPPPGKMGVRLESNNGRRRPEEKLYRGVP